MQSISSDYLQVTAALISFRGQLFIAQRPVHKSSGLYWEFPGGKVETGESPEDALVREIREELCWDIRVEKLFKTIRHSRNGFKIELHAFWCTLCGGSLDLREHTAYRWVSVEGLKQFNLTEADRLLLPLLEELPQVPPQDYPNRTEEKSWLYPPQ